MKTVEESTDTVSKQSGRVWIWVEEEIPTLEALVVIKLTVVYELIDATILQASDAERVTQKANQKYPEYVWQSVPCRGAGEFVVQGNLRADGDEV